MLWCRVVLYMMIIVGVPSVVLADPTVVSSVKCIRQDVSALRKEGVHSRDIVVVWDFHGVITSEPTHKKTLTLNPDVVKVLTYLKKRGVSQIIATAWDDFSVIQKAVVSLGLDSYFDVDLTETPLQDIKLGENGRVALQGYKNGKVVALRKPDDKGKYFRRKAFAPEVCFPERVFRRVLFIEDTLRNLELFEEDFPETIQYEQNNDQKLRLYHFRSPQKEREVQAHRPRGGNLRASGEYADVF